MNKVRKTADRTPQGRTGRLRAPPVAGEASKKEWQRSKFEAAVSAACKFRAPQQNSVRPRTLHLLAHKTTDRTGASGDGSLTKMTTATGDTLNYTYDALKRLNKVTTKNASGTALFSTSYAFKNLSTTDGITQTTTQVQYRNVRIGTNGTILEGKKYSYDDVGNITKISQSTSPYNPLVVYEYDSQNQLISEIYYDGEGSADTNITQAYYYTYDTAGNLLTVEEGTVNSGGAITKTTIQTYTYGTGDWKDLLTAVNGNTIIYEGQTYNASTGEVEGAATGNPTSYQTHGTFYDMSWANGRQLVYISCYEEHWQAAYTYDAEGIRTSKNDDGVLHTYVTQNGKVVRETIGTGSSAKVLDFIYDESGKPFALKYSTNNGSSFTTYYPEGMMEYLNISGTQITCATIDSSRLNNL